jgi:hypothetical protein
VNPKNESPRPIAVLRTAINPYLRGYQAQNQVALRAKLMSAFVGLETKKIIKICLTPPIACKSKWGPALQQEQEFESNEVRVSLLIDVNDDTACLWAIIPTRIFARRADESEGVPREQAPLPACHNDSTAVRAREALALSFIDKDLAPRAIPERIYARKPCTSMCERPPARRSLTFGKLFPAADVASKGRRPRSRGRPQSQGGRTFCEPFRPKPVVAQGQGRVDCRGPCQESTRTQGVTLKAEKTEAKSARCCGALHQARSSVSRAFVRTRREETKKGAASWRSLPSRKTRRAPHLLGVI